MILNYFLVKKEKALVRANISKLVSDSLGDKEYMNEIVILLNNNIEEFCDSTTISLKAKDRYSIFRAAHKIINGLEMIQAYVLLDYITMIQKECQYMDNFTNIKNLFIDFKMEYAYVLKEINSQIDNL
ncbi:hypothetical protein JM658_06320 [Joostella atrarenae]|uniref:HPt domain-containing protein n=1 Tax=Joostella atrarenae TaxID=679257 RepID=A0ABS9J1X3_9FLAO|nr:hypothetical protein [Joostella atrarenae]MCF8714443.1 hypothetical protein [Joostella atrarenae]